MDLQANIKSVHKIEKSKHKSLFKQIWQQRALYLFILPALAFTIVFNYRPMYGLIIAFQRYDLVKGIGGSEFVGLANFFDFLSRADFYNSFRNTAVISLLNILAFPLAIILALLINEYSMARFKRVVQSISYLPHFISWVIISGLLYKMLDQDTGIVNHFLVFMGMESIGFFREPKYFWGIYIISVIWKEIGWSSILYLSAMTGINPEIYEAAIVDGANRFRKVIHVTIPGIMPTIAVLFILGVSSFFTAGGAFEAIMTLRNSMISQTSDIIDIYTYYTGVRNANFGYATAIGMSQSILSITLLFCANKGMKKLTGSSLL